MKQNGKKSDRVSTALRKVEILMRRNRNILNYDEHSLGAVVDCLEACVYSGDASRLKGICFLHTGDPPGAP